MIIAALQLYERKFRLTYTQVVVALKGTQKMSDRANWGHGLLHSRYIEWHRPGCSEEGGPLANSNCPKPKITCS